MQGLNLTSFVGAALASPVYKAIGAFVVEAPKGDATEVVARLAALNLLADAGQAGPGGVTGGALDQSSGSLGEHSG